MALGVRLFGTRPYDEVQIGDIADAAGIAKGLLYHYFGDKRGLYLEVVRAASAELLQTLVHDPGLTGPENLRRGLSAYLGFVEARAEAYLALMRGGLQRDVEVERIIESVRLRIIERLAHGLGLKKLAPAFRTAARAFVGGVEAAALDWLEHKDMTMEALVDLLAAGLFGQLVVASSQSPGSGANIDLGSGFRLLGGMFGASKP